MTLNHGNPGKRDLKNTSGQCLALNTRPIDESSPIKNSKQTGEFVGKRLDVGGVKVVKNIGSERVEMGAKKNNGEEQSKEVVGSRPRG